MIKIIVTIIFQLLLIFNGYKVIYNFYTCKKTINYSTSPLNVMKFYTKFKQIFILNYCSKINKIIKIILQRFGSTIGKNIVVSMTSCLIILNDLNVARFLTLYI